MRPRLNRSRRAGTAFAVLFLLLPSYATLAYVVLPAVWRRHVPPPPQEEVPHLTYTAEGIPADPVNVALIGSEEELLGAMRAAGWTRADRISLQTGLRDVRSVLFNRPYSSAPMSTHFVDGAGRRTSRSSGPWAGVRAAVTTSASGGSTGRPGAARPSGWAPPASTAEWGSRTSPAS